MQFLTRFTNKFVTIFMSFFASPLKYFFTYCAYPVEGVQDRNEATNLIGHHRLTFIQGVSLLSEKSKLLILISQSWFIYDSLGSN